MARSISRATALAAFLAVLATSAFAQPAPCTDGMAGPYACEGMDLLSRISIEEFGSGSGNDVWGWTDPETGKEYALMGLRDGTGIVDVTNPGEPAYLGKLPTATEPSVWRDIKVREHYAFIVSEAPGHGMQVLDLTQLRGMTADPSRVFEADLTYTGTSTNPLGNVHNIFVNEDTGYAYAVGAQECAGGLYMININDPMNPAFEGCFDEDGYSHDVQCVVYHGPDEDYQGREICVGSNEDTITAVDVTDKSNPVMLGKGTYPTPAYTHQGWFTEDHRYFIADDELDEIQGFSERTRSMIFDMSDLDAPELIGIHLSPVPSADHNMYVLGDMLYQANYTSGLRVLDLSDIADGEMAEVASFDIYPETDAAQFNGAWSVYPYFESGTIVISGVEGGLFVVRPSSTAPLPLASFDASSNNGSAMVTWAPAGSAAKPFALQGRRGMEPFENLAMVGAAGPYRYDAATLSPGMHEFRLIQYGADGTIRVSETIDLEIEAPSVFRRSALMRDGDTGMIALTLAEPQEVRIALMDASGTTMKTIFNGTLDADEAHRFEVMGEGLPAGDYRLAITGEHFEDSLAITR